MEAIFGKPSEDKNEQQNILEILEFHDEGLKTKTKEINKLFTRTANAFGEHAQKFSDIDDYRNEKEAKFKE